MKKHVTKQHNTSYAVINFSRRLRHRAKVTNREISCSKKEELSRITVTVMDGLFGIREKNT